MTTATDWDVRDRETNDQLDVTEVRARIASLDGAATEVEPVDVHGLAEALARQTAQTDMLAAENAELRRRLGGWEPRRDPSTITSAADLTEREYNAGLYRPAELDDVDGEGMPLHAIGNSGTWPTWLDEVHLHQSRSAEIDAEFRAIIDRNTRDADSTVWDDELRALYAECEPIETDWWEREDRLMVGLVTREQQSVYDELAPEQLDEQALVPTGAPERYDPPRREDEPDRSDVEAMTEGRRRRDTLATRSSGDAGSTPQRRPWWTRYGDLIAGAVVGVAAFAALGVAWITGVLA